MKTIKEGFLRKNLGLGKDELIRKWLDEHNIKNYTINADLTIDVDGDVNLIHYTEKQLPEEYIQFGKVTGDFYFFNCKNLESLKGCPLKVNWDFNCSGCKNLTSLEGAPLEVGRFFNCWGCGKQFTIDDVEKVCKVKKKIRIQV